MRPVANLRHRRLRYAGAGALLLPFALAALTPAAQATMAGLTPAVQATMAGPTPAAPATVHRTDPPIRAALHVSDPSRAVLAGQLVTVPGRLLPARGGRQVFLQRRAERGWVTVAKAQTGRQGGFALHYRPLVLGAEPLRVRSAGGRVAAAGTVNVYRLAVASWYNDGGGGACAAHAYYGVANKTLPCGTHVSFRYGGRSVTAVVDDRGPYVAGRDYDLNQNSAAALGIISIGVATVWASR